jgi:hypothetical protein
MAFIIPTVAVDGGVSLIIWGVRKPWTNDDSADKRAKEFIAALPAEVKKYVKNVEFGPTGIKIAFTSNTPASIQKAIRENVRVA